MDLKAYPRHRRKLMGCKFPVHESYHGSPPSVKRLVWTGLDAVVASGIRVVHNTKGSAYGKTVRGALVLHTRAVC